jgi:hypothetical protein
MLETTTSLQTWKFRKLGEDTKRLEEGLEYLKDD